ncbi:hypothetical protein Tco_0001571 [Tanacetum coccineum]
MADDRPMWGNNRAVATTPGSAIVAVDLGDNFTVKVLKDHTHRRSVMTNPWEDLKKKKPTKHKEDIEETTMVEVPEISVTANYEMITEIHNSGEIYDPPVNPNAKTTIIYDDSEDKVDEAEKEVESSSSKQTKSNL